MTAGAYWSWRRDDTSITDKALAELIDRFDPPPPAPWNPTDGVSRYYGMVFYWFDRADFNIRIPLSVVNSKFDENDSLATNRFYIRWGGMHYKGAFCIVLQEPRSMAKRIPKPDRPATWRYHNGLGWVPFPDRTKMRWGYVNMSPQQIALHWWHTGNGEQGVAKIIHHFTFTGKYFLKEWPFKDPLYPVYQRIIAQLLKKDWQPQGSYFDVRKI